MLFIDYSIISSSHLSIWSSFYIALMLLLQYFFTSNYWCVDPSLPPNYNIFFFFFQLTLTSHVTEEDFQLGYSMSGHLERSFEKYISFQITHLAFVRRRDYFQDPSSDPNKSKPEVHQLTSFLTGSKSSNNAGTSGSNTGSSSSSQSKTARFVKNLCRVYLSSK